MLVNLILLAQLLTADTPSAEGPPVQDICSALARIAGGIHTPITVSGIYVSGLESSVIYSPSCDQNVQPVAWVEFADSVDLRALNRILSSDGRASVVMQGELYGPGFQPYSPRLSRRDNELSRILGGRYGYLGTYRAKLVVTAILRVARVDRNTPQLGDIPRRRLLPADIRPIAMEVPGYPEAARLAEIGGEVDVDVSVVDGKVRSLKATSPESVLTTPTLENIRSWRFHESVTTSFSVRFVYVLEGVEEAPSWPHIELDLPRSVRITASVIRW